MKKRCNSLDAFRAIVILLFIFANLLGTFIFPDSIPFLLKHNQGSTLLFIDLIAPAFAFILGAALYFSWKNSPKKNFMKKKIIIFTKIIILGFILDGLFRNAIFVLNWGVLQSLGLAGLFTLPFIKVNNKTKLVIGLLLLILYSQISIYYLPMPSLEPFRHGGIIGGIGYGFLALFGFISAELFTKKKELSMLGISLVALAVIVSTVIPFNKLEVTASFILISTGISILFWIFLSLFEKSIPNIMKILSRNSLFLWTLQYILIWYPLSILGLWRAVKQDFITGAIVVIGFIVLFSLIVIIKEKKGLKVGL